jgi:flagellar biosynthetic protein FliP
MSQTSPPPRAAFALAANASNLPWPPREHNAEQATQATELSPRRLIVRAPRRWTFAARRLCPWLVIWFALIGAVGWSAQTNSPSAALNGVGNLLPFHLNVGLESGSQPQDVDVGIKILLALTLLTLAPSIILLMTSFTRIVIVLSFIRSALTLQGAPANQIIVGLSLFLTFFIMAPVWERIDQDAIQPYMAKKISSEQALNQASRHIRVFMLRQTRPKDVELFIALAKMKPTPVAELPLKVVIPSFIISELRTAFQMGFLLFVPFILIDLVVATVLMSMGMMMMPPTTIAMPLKILLFVLVDGWALVVRSVVQSFVN